MRPATPIRLRLALAVAATAAAGAAFAQVPQAAPRSPADSADKPVAALRAEPVPPAVDAAFRAWDRDGDGSLSLAEFRGGWQALRQGGRQTIGAAGLRQQFDRLDANDNDGIDRVEYSEMVLVKRAGAMAPPFSEADSNRSQKIEFDEYGALVQRLRAAGAASAPSPPRAVPIRPAPGG
jgi:hypothetical protein